MKCWKRFIGCLLGLCVLLSTSQVGDCTVIVIVRKGAGMWVGANSNISRKLPKGGFEKAGEDCKIHQIGNGKLVMLHGGPLFYPDRNGGVAKFVDLIEGAANPSLSLFQNRNSVVEAIEDKYREIGRGMAAANRASGKELWDHWYPIAAQTVVLVSARPNEAPEMMGFVVAMAMDKDEPRFVVTGLNIPPVGDFSMIIDGKKFPPVEEKWTNPNQEPLEWIRQKIGEKGTEDEADWGGEVEAAKLTGAHGLQWLQPASPCQSKR